VPEDFIARLAALVPKPRAHLTRYHGVFAPESPDRVQIVPSTRSAGATERGEVSVSDRQRAMLWAQRLKRVFAIDIETCQQCGGRLRVIASIETPAVIERILEYLGGLVLPAFAGFHPGPTDCVTDIRPLIRTIRPYPHETIPTTAMPRSNDPNSSPVTRLTPVTCHRHASDDVIHTSDNFPTSLMRAYARSST